MDLLTGRNLGNGCSALCEFTCREVRDADAEEEPGAAPG